MLDRIDSLIQEQNQSREERRQLEITALQAEGGKRMAAPDYFRGHPLED